MPDYGGSHWNGRRILHLGIAGSFSSMTESWPIKIGYVAPLTGDGAALGVSAQKAVESASQKRFKRTGR